MSKSNIITKSLTVPKTSALSENIKIKNNYRIKTQDEQTIENKPNNNSNNISQTNNQYNITQKKLLNVIFKHHDKNLCVCDDCICGRHLCKLENIKPDLSKNSQYRQNYKASDGIKGEPIKVSKNILKMPIIEHNSTYKNSYLKDRLLPIQKAILPVHNLKCGGPFQNGTSYKANFPGHHADSIIVKPVREPYKSIFPFQDTTTYGKQYNKRPTKVVLPIKKNDNLHVGSGWLGSSSYKDNFKTPNPQDYQKIKKDEKKLNNFDNKYQGQFDTTYNKDFIEKNNQVCPAKIALQAKLKENNSKDKLAKNLDHNNVSSKLEEISK